jgi:hypothetical protein
MQKLKKVLKIAGIIIGILLLIWGIDLINTRRKIARGDLVKWEGQWYTKEQLYKKYPPQYIEVPAKNTPEEVYARFREALLKNDIEGALNEMVIEKREQYRQAFADKAKFNVWVKRFPEIINKDTENGNFATYFYINNSDSNDRISHPITYIKNSEGYWQIDTI